MSKLFYAVLANSLNNFLGGVFFSLMDAYGLSLVSVQVFGFAQSVEQAATPITAFMIGPIAQLIFIPFMTTGAGVDLIGDWFGTGSDRGLALVFTVAGVIGLIVTLLAMRSYSYKTLAANYQKQETAPA